MVEGRVVPERAPANNDQYYMKVPEILASDEDNYLEILREKIVSLFLLSDALFRPFQQKSFSNKSIS